jgi:23S rRNA (uracil1939-C5)-methyltransferase
VPGDVVDLQVKRKKNHYAEAVAVKFHEKSPLRTEPFCSHFGVCGGCKWQCLSYEEQLKYKQKQVFDNLTRIGKVELPEFRPILGSEKTRFYRNKLEFTFSNKRWLTEEEVKQDVKYDQMNAVGFHIPGAFDKVLAIDKCWLQDDISNQIRNAVRDYAYAHNFPFFDLRTQEGLLRNIMIRTSSTGELMVVLQCKVTDDEGRRKMEEILQFMADSFPQITSLMYVINNKCNDTIGDLDVEVFKGNDHIFEEMEELRFKVGPKSFYQTNSEQAYNLYKVAREFAGLTGNELVYDLYTGTGTIANFVARQARKVVGIEYVPEAIEDAKVNSDLNGIDNTLFYAGDMKDILTNDFIAEHGRPDVIITDPPRAGMHNDVIDVILAAEPKRIVYVSCNPATQARDLQLLDGKYKVTAVQPVDMFPHTHHVENVVQLERR